MREQWTRIMAAGVAALFFMSVGAHGLTAQEEQAIQEQDTLQQAQIDAPSGFQNASEVTGLPQFVPGLGILFVKQENLPVGPFLAYSPEGKLMSTVLFIPTTGTQTMPGQQERGFEQQGQQEQEWRQQEEERQREQEREDEWGQQQQEQESPQQEQQQGMQQQQVDLSQFTELQLEENEVDHLEIRFNQGFSAAQSGLNQPHYQVVLWHVSSEEARELDQMGLAQGEGQETAQREYGEEQQREYGEREQEARRDEETFGQEQQQEQQEQEAGVVGMEVDIDAPEGFERASEIARLPEFVPNVGILYVEPNNVPVGPYLAYDREGELVSTVLLLPATKDTHGMKQQQPGYEQQKQEDEWRRQEEERQREQGQEDEWGQEQEQEYQQQQQQHGMQPQIDLSQFTQMELEEKDINHVAIEYSEGLSGATSPLDGPHYRVILWHISPEDARDVSRFQGDTQGNR